MFTNLTQDHLDFHGTLDDYYAAKRSCSCRRAATPAAAVINVDDEWGRKLAAELTASRRDAAVTFAVERDADYRARAVRYDAAGSTFECATAARRRRGAASRCPGSSTSTTRSRDRRRRRARRATRRGGGRAGTPRRVPGRFEPVEEGQAFGVLVDYAHTPDSLENVLDSARELLDQAGGEGRLIVVFGAGGDRDREKRPLMGAAARRLADHTLVTSDNPRSEEPDAIIAAIVAGAEAPPAGEGSRWRSRPTAAPRSSARWSSRGPATSC